MVRVAVVACFGFALSLSSACSLYFGPGAGDDSVDDEPSPDGRIDPPLPDAPTGGAYLAYCAGGGVLYRTDRVAGAPTTVTDAVYTQGTRFDSCPNGCAVDSTFVSCGDDASCAVVAGPLCAPPLRCPETGQTCNAPGATVRCTQPVACAVTAAVNECTCQNGAYQCRPSCTPDQNGLCGPAGVGDAMTGTWRGTVTPPSFATPYDASLILKPDRTYVSQSPGDRAVFYYGKDGGLPVYRWRPMGVGPTGGIATVDIYFGAWSIRTGLVTNIQRDPDRLRFTFWDSWLDCSRPFNFDLTRQP